MSIRMISDFFLPASVFIGRHYVRGMLQAGWSIEFLMGVTKAQFLQQVPGRSIFRIVTGKQAINDKIPEGKINYPQCCLGCISVSPVARANMKSDFINIARWPIGTQTAAPDMFPG